MVSQAPKLSIVLELDQRQFRHGQHLSWTVQASHAAVYDPDEVRLLALAARYEARCPWCEIFAQKWQTEYLFTRNRVVSCILSDTDKCAGARWNVLCILP